MQTVNSTTYDDFDSYHKIEKEVEEKEVKEDIETNDLIDEVDHTENVDPVDQTEQIDPTEEIDLDDPVDPVDSTIIKTGEDITIEKHLKNYLDKDDEE